MRYQYREGQSSGSVHIGHRKHAEIEDGEFEVPSEYDGDARLHQRMIDAGHRPVDPEALPEGVEYDPSEESESGSESDSNGEDDESPSEERTGAITSEAFSEDADEEERYPSDEAEGESLDLSEDELDSMNRSELYSVGNEQLDLGWAWSGEDALSETEMRAELKELANDG